MSQPIDLDAACAAVCDRCMWGYAVHHVIGGWAHHGSQDPSEPCAAGPLRDLADKPTHRAIVCRTCSGHGTVYDSAAGLYDAPCCDCGGPGCAPGVRWKEGGE